LGYPIKLATAITIAFLITVLMKAVVAGPVAASTITVEADGSGDSATIQLALDAAEVNDTILLGAGVFTGGGNRGLRAPELLAAGCIGPSNSGCSFEAVTISSRTYVPVELGMEFQVLC